MALLLCQRGLAVCLAAALAMLVLLPAKAADPAFVGKLALAVDPEVAKEIGLTDEVRGQLEALVDKREGEALEKISEVKDLPEAEKSAKMAEFVAESEKQGLELLTEEQKEKLTKVGIGRAGMVGLADPKTAAALKLTEEQKGQIAKQITDYQQVLGTGTDLQKQVARGFAEKKIAGLLTDEQKATWETLSGVPAGTATAAPAGGATAQAPGPGSGTGFGPFRAPGGSTGGNEGTGPTRSLPKYQGAVVREDGKLEFKFRFAPWRDVIDWFAEQAGLSLVSEVYPPGTFSYTDKRAYTPEEALDLLNTVLATKGYTLVRREKMAIVFNLQDGPVPLEFVPVVTPDKLDKLGEFELVSCLFQLSRMTAEEAEAEVNRLKGPQGTVVLLSKAKQVYVTEHAGKLRTIARMIESIEEGAGFKDEKVQIIQLKELSPSEFLSMVRTSLQIPEGTMATVDGTLRLAIDELGGKIIATGKQVAIDRVLELQKLVDLPLDESTGPIGTIEEPQLIVYPITQADPDGVLAVLSTLLATETSVRMAKDPKTGHIIVFAKPSDHAKIRATIDEMQRDATKTEVIKLRNMDPSEVVLAVNQLFGDPTGKDPLAAAKMPKMYADAINMTITVRGSPSQIEQVREYLMQVGEIAPEGADIPTERSNIRTLSASGRSARSALEQLELFWPATGRKNRLNIKIPSNPNDRNPSSTSTQGRLRTGDPTIDALIDQYNLKPEDFGPGGFLAPPALDGPPPSEGEQGPPPVEGEQPAKEAPVAAVEPLSPPPGIKPSGRAVLIPVPRPGQVTRPPAQPAEPAAKPVAQPQPNVTRRKPSAVGKTYFVGAPFVAQAQPAAEPAEPKAAAEPVPTEPKPEAPAPATPAAEKPEPQPAEAQPSEAKPAAGTEESTSPGAGAAESEPEPPEVLISVASNGTITIASKDLDALDEIEEQLRALIDNTGTGKEFNIYYLRYCKAETAASLLTEILSGSSGAAEEGGGGGLMGDIASQMMGGMAGDLLGGILGGPAGGGGAAASGTMSIIPDPRLNALVVQATSRDLDSIEQLLEVIDKPESGVPVETTPMPKFIEVKYGDANEIATIIRQVFASKLQADASSNQQRQPSPEDFLRALRGGGSRGGRGGSQQNRGEEQKMTIGVDTKSNSLIVSAPDYLFQQVRDMVEQLDQRAVATRADQMVRVVNVKHTGNDLMQRSLSSRLGASATINKSTTTTTASTSTSRSTTSSPSSSGRTSSGQPSTGSDNGGGDAMRNMMMLQELQRRSQDSGSSRGGGDRGSSRGGSGFPSGGFPGGGGGFPGGGSSRGGGGFGGFPGGRP